MLKFNKLTLTALVAVPIPRWCGMVKEVAAQHPGAIQVLGCILCAVAGTLTPLA